MHRHFHNGKSAPHVKILFAGKMVCWVKPSLTAWVWSQGSAWQKERIDLHTYDVACVCPHIRSHRKRWIHERVLKKYLMEFPQAKQGSPIPPLPLWPWHRIQPSRKSQSCDPRHSGTRFWECWHGWTIGFPLKLRTIEFLSVMNAQLVLGSIMKKELEEWTKSTHNPKILSQWFQHPGGPFHTQCSTQIHGLFYMGSAFWK